MAAKAHRLLRVVMTTAVEEDKILARNPCRVRGAGEEHAPERPVLTVDRSSTWPSGSATDLSATFASFPVAVTGFASAEMATCAPRRRSTTREPRPNAHCGTWPMAAGRTSTMMGASVP
jgi:hypothetical protein